MKSIYKISKELFAEIKQMRSDTDKENALFKAMHELYFTARAEVIDEYFESKNRPKQV